MMYDPRGYIRSPIYPFITLLFIHDILLENNYIFFYHSCIITHTSTTISVNYNRNSNPSLLHGILLCHTYKVNRYIKIKILLL